VSGGRSLLAVNFRDPAHPEAGGAELHLEHILVEAVARGIAVTWLASGFPNGAAEDSYRGIRVLRRGNWWNFNWIAPRVLVRELSHPKPDWIVEDINKAPCLLPFFTARPVAVVVPHLFGATAFREANPLVALYVVGLEALIPWVYRASRVVVISESTREDLVRRGLDAARVAVVHCGLDHHTYRVDPAVRKSDAPTILFVGRLRRYKGLDWVLRSLPAVLARVPAARLVVVGDGPHGAQLERDAKRLGIGHAVAFRGFVSAAEKVRLLQSSWVLIQPSPKEGWGLTVVEAGGCGTAVVATDAPGLRDSVRHGVTGLLVRYQDTAALAEALGRVLEDADLRERLARAGREWAARFQWSECAARSLDFLLAQGTAR